MKIQSLRSSTFLMPLLALATSVGAQATQNPPPNDVSSSAGNIKIEKLATLEYPWGMALLPDGRLLITEKPGRLRIWEKGRLSEPVQGVPTVVYRRAGEQGGLLDVEADPNFAANHLVYVSYSEADPQGTKVAEINELRFAGPRDQTDSIVRGAAVARGRLEGSELRDVKWEHSAATNSTSFSAARITDGRTSATVTTTPGHRSPITPRVATSRRQYAHGRQ